MPAFPLEICLAITDDALIETLRCGALREAQIIQIQDPLPYEVLDWINILKGNDEGMAMR